jgi:2'-5' RNA ligase
VPDLRAVLAFPPANVDEALNATRRHFDPLVGFVASHLTLVFPSQIDAEGLKTHVAEVAGRHPPITVRLHGFAGADGTHLMARVVAGNDALIALHDDLYRGVLRSALDRTRVFVPHVTVGRVTSDDELLSALSGLDDDVTWRFVVGELVIYRIGEDKRGEAEAVVPLTGRRRQPRTTAAASGQP